MIKLYTTLPLLILIYLYLNLNLFADTFVKWKEEIKEEAKLFGISESIVSKSIDEINNANKKVLKYYNNQPEFKISFSDYQNRNISKKRIEKGKKLLNKHKSILKQISIAYKVPAEVIVSIWAIESNYGNYTGSYNIIDSLLTLSFASKRKNFFKKELFNALKILDKKLIDATTLKGSWAGAMGQSQFMPSSYLNYAVDFNYDNKIDIWKTDADVFASIANYLNRHGWKENAPWSIEVQPKKLTNIDTKKKYSIEELISRNILKKDHYDYPIKNIASFLKINDKKEDRFFLVFKNFDVIKRYNNSNFYALTVGSLTNKLIRVK